MKLFLDTIDLQSIEHWRKLEIIEGVTTNPTTLVKAKDPLEHLKKIVSIMSPYDVSIQLTSQDLDAQLKEAEHYREIGKDSADNVVIKVPGLPNNLFLAQKLKNLGFRINITLVFTPMQAALYAKTGADYVSQFVGRMYDHNLDGLATLKQTITAVKAVDTKCQVLAASIRNQEQLIESINLGVDVVTVSPSVLKESLESPLTTEGYEKFLADWKAK